MSKRRKRSGKKRSSIRKQKNFFMTSHAQTLEQYIIASILTGAFTATGAVIGTVLAKYLLREVDKTGLLPNTLHVAISENA